MTEFILNNDRVVSHAAPGTSLLQVIRREFRLTGSKLACGEGECGACTVLVGTLHGSNVRYRSVTACITPLTNVAGRHVLTIEGITQNVLTPVQQAMVDCNGTQCGFCTPGFVVSLTGQLLDAGASTAEQLIAAMDGNICRCTGYTTIKGAAAQVADHFDKRKPGLETLIAEGVIPAWMGGIADRLGAIEAPEPELVNLPDTTLVGGGTDLYVQQPHAMPSHPVTPASRIPALHGIRIEDGTCSIGAAETMSSLQHSALLNDLLPGLHDFMAPVGSTQIRNTATLAGNLVNASPIGDLTILFLALDSSLSLSNGREVRTVRLRDFYLGYKQLALQEGECVQSLMFQLPSPEAGLHFERVCKRTYLDVASVNSACLLEMGDDGTIQQIHLSMGGVAPIPKYLAETCSFFLGKTPDRTLVWKGIEVLQDEIAPISDIRGSADYKRLLARQQLLIHFSRLAPAFVDLKSLLGA